MVCNIGNPLAKGHHTFYAKYFFQPVGESKFDSFKWHVNNTNDGISSSTIPRIEKVGIRLNTGIRINAKNDYIQFTSDMIWPSVRSINHVYTIANTGDVDVKQAKILIEWPEFTNSKPPQQLLKLRVTKIEECLLLI